MPNTINLRLLDNKQIKVEMQGIALAAENGYRIIAGEENTTQFTIASTPTQYTDYNYYVFCINSKGYKCPLDPSEGTPVEGEEGDLLIGDTFTLPLGMAVEGYGYINIYAKDGTEKVVWQTIKVKIWQTFDHWQDYVSKAISYKDTFTPNQAVVVNGIITDDETRERIAYGQPINYRGKNYYVAAGDTLDIKYFTVVDGVYKEIIIAWSTYGVIESNSEDLNDLRNDIDTLQNALDGKVDKIDVVSTTTLSELVGNGGIMLYGGQYYTYSVYSPASGVYVFEIESLLTPYRYYGEVNSDLTLLQAMSSTYQSNYATQDDLDGLVPNTRTVNGHALSSDVTITKGDIGLGNVDNTSDLNKPISTATQAALVQKVDLIQIGPGDKLSDIVARAKSGIIRLYITDYYYTFNIIPDGNGGYDFEIESLSDMGRWVGFTPIDLLFLDILNDSTYQDDYATVQTVISSLSNYATITALDGKQDKLTQSTDLSSTSQTLTLSANTRYALGTLTALDITFPASANDGDTIIIEFVSGSTATTLTRDTTNAIYNFDSVGSGVFVEFNAEFKVSIGKWVVYSAETEYSV